MKYTESVSFYVVTLYNLEKRYRTHRKNREKCCEKRCREACKSVEKCYTEKENMEKTY